MIPSAVKRSLERLLVPAVFVNRRVLDVARFELGCLLRTVIHKVDPLHHARVLALRRRRGLSLNVGSGGSGLHEWVNIDAHSHSDCDLVLDIRRRLPFVDEQIRRIRAEHVIEHLDFRHDVPRVFGEFYRVLEPGGVLRVVVPDGRRYLEAYVTGDRGRWRGLGWELDQLPEDLFTPMHVINHIFHQSGEHLFAYDFETMAFALKRAGFREVSRQCYGDSLDPELARDREVHARYSLYVDARK